MFEEYEEEKTAEAKFVRVMDNFQPLLLNDSNNGEDWKVKKICKSQVINRQKTSQAGSEEIWKYTKELIERNVKRGNLINE